MEKYQRSPEGEARRIASMPKHKKHWKWCNNPSKLTLHRRLHRWYGSAKGHPCGMPECKKMAQDYANVTGNYTDDMADYVPMCRSCHVYLDRNWEKK